MLQALIQAYDSPFNEQHCGIYLRAHVRIYTAACTGKINKQESLLQTCALCIRMRWMENMGGRVALEDGNGRWVWMEGWQDGRRENLHLGIRMERLNEWGIQKDFQKAGKIFPTGAKARSHYNFILS
ncbi:hypothetical protein POVWA2_059580 [Plasmodium ovale wallikeri]|uniref:Uncharacterized protein n=1 Tax=Plasmodium ovale wallikeri TaxID=864142 RepID=A0A1A9A1W2_PLAOA|nr:hypothetical protein POVWA1_014770 [Plasmodium ovale wallikeri]SBT50152.1 hypothetical protein POVWA2_059580 [Plasmodium ovale wallikeri]